MARTLPIKDNQMAKERFSIPKKFGASEVTFFDDKNFDVKDKVTVPVNGIPGLAGYGFVSLLDAQLVGGPKTPEYVAETAANLSVYLSGAWKPGDSAGIMRRKFQLTRALAVISSKKGKNDKMVSFAAVLSKVTALSDAERQAMWLLPQVQGIVSGWNAKGERKAVDVSAAFKSLTG